MSTEQELEQERSQIVEAIEWVDAERKRLSRHCFAETRKKWHGEKERGRTITLMKKESEWLFRQRCRLRERLGAVNAALRGIRLARRGTVTESFGAAFVATAREKLDPQTFAAILDETTRRCGGKLQPSTEAAPEAVSLTALDELKKGLAAFKESNMYTDRPPAKQGDNRERESQADFNLANVSGNRRIFADFDG